mgnify:CR=1 FL=1
MGEKTGLKGILLVIDPKSSRRALALGRNGPHISGADFRKWHEEFVPSDDFRPEENSKLIVSELRYMANKLLSIG